MQRWRCLLYVEKLSFFHLFSLYASDNVVHILLQLGTLHAHYTNHKNYLVFFLTLNKVYKKTAVSFTAGQCWTYASNRVIEQPMFWLHRWMYTFWIKPSCLANFNTTQEMKYNVGKDKLSWDCFRLWVKSQNGGCPAGRLGMLLLLPEDESWSPQALLEHSLACTSI